MDSAETQIQARRRDTRYVFMMFEFGMHHESHGSKAGFAKKKNKKTDRTQGTEGTAMTIAPRSSSRVFLPTKWLAIGRKHEESLDYQRTVALRNWRPCVLKWRPSCQRHSHKLECIQHDTHHLTHSPRPQLYLGAVGGWPR
jgi:hypothetical protein